MDRHQLILKDALNNSFVQQFADNIKFNHTSFERVIIRGYIRSLFFEAGVVRFLRAMGFSYAYIKQQAGRQEGHSRSLVAIR